MSRPRAGKRRLLKQVGAGEKRLGGWRALPHNNGVIEIRPVKRNPREHWTRDSQRIAETGHDVLAWPEFGNEGDAELVW
ncbi:MAG: hypothetical protein Q8O52_11435 [Sulfuritalea sp.]|nr:hypothetical protein [Sulfuritalea sp.]